MTGSAPELIATLADTSLSDPERMQAAIGLDTLLSDSDPAGLVDLLKQAGADQSLGTNSRSQLMSRAATQQVQLLNDREGACATLTQVFDGPEFSADNRCEARKLLWGIDEDRARALAVFMGNISDPEANHMYRSHARLTIAESVMNSDPDFATSLCEDQIADAESIPHNRSAARHTLYQVLKSQNKIAESIQVLEEDIDDPTSVPEAKASSRGILAEALMTTDPDRAESLLLTNVTDPEVPDNIRPVSRDNLISLYKREGKQEELFEQLKATVADPAARPVDASEAMRQLADIFRKASDYENAIHWYEALLAHPAAVIQNRAMAKRNLALLLSSTDQQRAIKLMTELSQDGEMPIFVKETATSELELIKAGIAPRELVNLFDDMPGMPG